MEAAADNLRLREPGFWPVGVERWRVAGLGAVALPVFCGDEVQVVDPQGLQTALVAGFDRAGECMTGALGLTENTDGAAMACADVRC